MAVYDLRDRDRYSANNLLGYGLARGVGGLFDNFINGMFQRDAEARDSRKFAETLQALQDAPVYQEGTPAQEAFPIPQRGAQGRGLFDSVENGSYDSGLRENLPFLVEPNGAKLTTRQNLPFLVENDQKGRGLWDSTPSDLVHSGKNTGRLWDYTQQGGGGVSGGNTHYGTTQDVYSALAKLKSVNPRHFAAIMGGLRNQLSNNENLLYQDTVASRVRDLPMDVRGNPVQATQSGLVAQAYGLRPEGLWRYTAPNFEKQVIDLGDRALQSSFDPLTGGYENREMGYGLNPTKRYESDADTEQAKISAGAQRYVADRNYDGKWVPSFKEIYGPNGEVQALNTRTGRVTDTGARSYPRGSGGQGGTKPLTPQQKLSIGQAALKSTMSMGSPEEKWDYILRMSGGDSEALDAMARAVFNGGQVPMAAAEFFRTGSARPAGQGGQPQVQGQPAARPSASSSLLPGSATGNSIIVAEARSRFPQETRGMSDEEVLAELMKYK